MRPFHYLSLTLISIATFAVFVVSGSAANAAANAALIENKPALAKVSSHLLRARQLSASGKSAAEIAAAVPTVRQRDGRLKVEIRLDTLTPAVLNTLRSLGLEVDSFHLDYGRAYGRLDLAYLDDIAALPEVVAIKPMPRARTRIGAAHNQADVTMNSDEVRTMYGYDGTGVAVGILSDSFNNFGGGTVSGIDCSRTVTGTSSQGSGDLLAAPGDVLLFDDGPGGGSDEGRAIAELMADIAPGANFMFHSAFNSPADFAGGITELVGCGADLIVDDVGWSGQAFFQDDIIAQAAQDAVDAGVWYFSAAGNDATFGVDDVYLDINGPSDNMLSPPDGDDFHDFGGGDIFAAITVPDDCEIVAELQWAECFDSIGSCLGATSDLDLYLLDSEVDPDSVAGDNILDSSTDQQGAAACTGASGDPIESVSYTNQTGSPDTVFLAVDHYCGDQSVPLHMRMVTVSFNCNTTSAPWNFEDGGAGETSIFVDSQIFGHPAARDVVAVGAAFFAEVGGLPGIPPGDLDPPLGQLDVEAFSSLGGYLPYYFDRNGDWLPIAPEMRFKPDVTGPDCTNTTFFGIDIDDGFEPPGDTDPNFCGTSASAPNSAAIAALILDATDLNITPLALKQLFSQSAIDMELPGRDDLSGSGFTDLRWPLNVLVDLDSSIDECCSVENLEFDLDGGAFFRVLLGTLVRVRVLDTMTLGNGDYTGVEGVASKLIFVDGFKSGNTSVWINTDF